MLGYMNNIVIYNEILEWYHGIKWDVVIYIDRYEWWSGIKLDISRDVNDVMIYNEMFWLYHEIYEWYSDINQNI